MDRIDTKHEDDEEKRSTVTQECALSAEENLEEGLEASMDGSDPLSATQPGDHGEPVESSGYHGEGESEDDKEPGKRERAKIPR